MRKRLNIFLSILFFAMLLCIYVIVVLNYIFPSYAFYFELLYFLIVAAMFMLFPLSILSLALSIGCKIHINDTYYLKKMKESPIRYLVWKEIRDEIERNGNWWNRQRNQIPGTQSIWRRYLWTDPDQSTAKHLAGSRTISASTVGQRGHPRRRFPIRQPPLRAIIVLRLIWP